MGVIVLRIITAFDVYYKKYIGCDEDNSTYVKSIYRDRPINKNYYYPLIKSLYQNKTVISVSSQVYCEEYKSQSVDAIYSLSLKRLLSLYPKAVEKQFNRYSFGKDTITSSSSVHVLKDEHKDFFMRTGKNLDPVFKEKKWQELENNVKQQNMFIEICDNKIVSSCKISDVYCDAANLYVFTDEKYRKRGFGKNVVSMAIKYCLNNNLLPIYFAETCNLSSIALATSLGFTLQSKEKCACVVR